MNDFATYSRRAFLGGIGKAALVGSIAGAGLLGDPSRVLATVGSDAAAQAPANPPLVWVWKFSADGTLDSIKQTLKDNGLGIILKTHDGNEWMTRFDKSPDAVISPQQVAKLANSFEQDGVPFHAWCVVQGLDPIAEAQMCAQVLDAGARSIYFDLEPEQGGNYWHGSWDNASRFGEELRRLKPDAWLTTAPDARPWQAPAVPLAEFATFSNAIAPQSYWATFQGPANQRHFAETGFPVGPDGVTPEFIADVCKRAFAPFNLPVQPIGQGAADGAMWQRFVAALDANGMQPVSLWRYGTADPSAYPVLKQVSARSIPVVITDVAHQSPQATTQPPPATAPQDAPQGSATIPQQTQDVAQPSGQAPSSQEPQPYGPALRADHITPPTDAGVTSTDPASTAATSSTSRRRPFDLSRFQTLLQQQTKVPVAATPQARPKNQLASILAMLIGR